MEPIKFFALDRDDLAVVSTHLQDAEVKIADVHWRPQEKRLVLGSTVSTGWPRPLRRRNCAAAGRRLRFERVLACKCRHVDPAGNKDGPDAAGGRIRGDCAAGRRGDADLLRAGRCCGSKSSVWRRNLPTWGRVGRPVGRVRSLRWRMTSRAGP